jgi:hypothetical protein
MRDETQPLLSRGVKLSGAAIVAALIALLAIAPLASAASDPVASGSTKVTLNNGLYKKLKKNGVKVLKVKPATVKGKKITLPIKGAESSLDPTTGAGTLVHEGGFKLKAGKKKAVVKNLVLNTVKKALSGKVGKKKLKIAAVAGVSFVRDGFGADVVVKKLKLTKKAAKLLNKALDENVFKANKSLGSASSAEQPLTVTVTGGNGTLAADIPLVKKLNDVEVKIETISPTTEPTKIPPVFAFPLTGGALSPTATAGTVQTGGGLRLIQKLQTGATTFITTTITLGSFWLDFTARTASVEVVAESDASKELNLGNLGRSSIADISLTGATVTADSTSHTITVQNAPATVQPVAAEVLEGFVKVYEGYWQKIFEGPPFEFPEAVAKEKAAEKVKEDHIHAGDPLGTFSFTAQTQ